MIPFDYQYHFERHMLTPRTNAVGIALIFVGAPLCGESCETEILLEIPGNRLVRLGLSAVCWSRANPVKKGMYAIKQIWGSSKEGMYAIKQMGGDEIRQKHEDSHYDADDGPSISSIPPDWENVQQALQTFFMTVQRPLYLHSWFMPIILDSARVFMSDISAVPVDVVETAAVSQRIHLEKMQTSKWGWVHGKDDQVCGQNKAAQHGATHTQFLSFYLLVI